MKIQEIRGEDGEYRCSVCGCVTRRSLDVPLFDGKGSKDRKRFRVMCRCQEEAERKEKERQKYEADMAAVGELKKLSLMDKKLKDASFSTYQVDSGNARAYRAAVRYVDRFDNMLATGQGILFLGPVGTGKSYTAAMIANEVINRKRSAIMTSFVKLLDAMSKFGTVDEDYITRLNHADLLFIDDLGTERSTDTAIEKVYNVIDSRYRSCKPLILTTNLEMEEISREKDIRYARIYDRIFEMCYPIRMGGQSWRKQEAARRYEAMKNLLEG